jgi:hypothetical protein
VEQKADDSVTGLNLDDSQSASKVIKPWDERLDEVEYIESGVDDDVRLPLMSKQQQLITDK